jgi:multisubunit Na+/H+ antiporter MnhC subunit
VALGFAALALMLVLLYRHAQDRKAHLEAIEGTQA